MYKAKDIVEVIERLAPLSLAESWDNSGFLLGDLEQRVSKVFVCLDVTAENVTMAEKSGAQLIISHHPLIFSPVKNIREDNVNGSIITSLIKSGISVYSAHTSLDNADGGTNDILAEKLGLDDVRRFTDEECLDGDGNPLDNIGRVGTLNSPVELADFVSYTKSVLGCRTIRYVGNGEEPIQKVALCTGAGGSGIYTAYRSGADVYVTADIRHHEAQLACELGLNLIDAGHFETENTVCEFIPRYLSEAMPELTIYTSAAEPYFK